LPRHLDRGGWVLVGAGVLLVAVSIVVGLPSFSDMMFRFEGGIGALVGEFRVPWLTTVMRGIDTISDTTVVWALRIALIVVLAITKRWWHLLTFIAVLVVVDGLSAMILDVVARVRPVNVTILTGWRGFSYPSIAIVTLAVTLIPMVYSLVPGGEGRRRAGWIVAGLIALASVAHVYLGASHAIDVAAGAALAATVAIPAFRYFVPEGLAPVSYGGGNAAHLDLGGERGRAIREAIEEQLGYTVENVAPFGEAGSGASTPMRIKIAELEVPLFAKLYATRHVRADRNYKIARTVLYGHLEDETPFGSVRRLIEYEDYALRLLTDLGVPVAENYGIVELTPDREYMLVTGFFEGASEIGDAEVDDTVIDEGLRLVRTFWDNGLAARDVKPSNFLVQDGHLRMIDVFFLEVRASSWRQAVDLANMMLTLALRSEPEVIYEHALRYFTPAEIGEAFAAIKGLAVPTELSSAIKKDSRDLAARFKELAPPTPRISIQRWSLRRVGLIAGVLFGGLIALLVVIATLGSGLS
jgi:membrane-associated phospholipid phosphatase